MTEDELLDIFRAVAAVHVAPGDLSPGALAWVEHKIELAAARAADRPELSSPAAAREAAEAFFSRLLPSAGATIRPFAVRADLTPVITAEALDQAYAAFAIWPFGQKNAPQGAAAVPREPEFSR
jgi:hypothetical protein